MFGATGQKKIEAQKVGIVGLGGLGSPTAHALALAGVRQFVLVDPDRNEESNLNRQTGAYPEDVGRLKVDTTGDLIVRINPRAQVQLVSKDLRTRDALEALLTCSVIFGCVDRDAPRLVLTELAAAYEIALIDIATEIFPEEKNRPFDFGGRVVVARPGDFCLFCANQIDSERAKAELESPEIRALREKHGYGLGPDLPAPAVVALNGIVANLGVMEFLAMVTGLRDVARKLTYKGMRGVVTSSTDTAKPDCYVCHYLRGQREFANIWRYLLSEQAVRSLVE